MRHFFVLAPSLHPTGPVKGAYALANALAGTRPVTLVTLKPGPGVDSPLDARVERVDLSQAGGNWWQRRDAYRALLWRAGGRRGAASISLCLSADWVNRDCRADAVICSSVRGNLPRNYRHDYGVLGLPLAVMHLRMLAGFDHVAAMTGAMARQVARHTRRMPAVIGNCVDEAALESYRVAAAPAEHARRFVFVGSLGPRKQPLLLLGAVHALLREGERVALDIVGDGPLRAKVQAETRRLGLDSAVTLHGHLRDPLPLVARAHAFVLPSLSEGVSRAALESLHLGVPCVLRNVDGNAEIIRPGVNGALFEDDAALADAMRRAAAISATQGSARASLLPPACRQAEAARRYQSLLEAGDD
jgi:glycosyltransferase involved in cell wall biosynthesis